MDTPDLEYVPGSFVGPLDCAEIAKFEKWLHGSEYHRINFDATYVDYLFRFHGGVPGKRYFQTKTGTGHVLERFLNFLPSGSNNVMEQYNVEVTWSNVSDRMGLYLMPFGELFAGDLLCFDHEQGNPPKVVLWFHEHPAHTEPVADNFAEFLSLLRSDYE
jgi:hypothetical protein